MYKNLRKALLILLSVMFVVCCVAFSACSSCNPENNKPDPDETDTDEYDGLFAGTSHNYVLTSDYKLTEADVKATAGDDSVTLGYICSFELGGHTLDLNGYTLNVTSTEAEVVKFENGKIKNGVLNVSVPNGDIEFTATSMDETVTYELEAASETIKFSNSIVSGKCTIKSDTNVSVEYSNVGDLTLAGNGTLTAGSGAELGAVTVSENASGATVNISSSATVSNVQLQAAANVSVAGSVSAVTVAESAKNDSASLSITIEETASVDKVELNAAASVSVAGSVSAVTVAESAKNDSASLSIDIGATASVAKVELNAAASVSVAGSVQAVTVGASAKNDTAELSINVADTAEVSRVELNAPAAVEVSGGVSNIVVAESAGGSSVTLTETASVTTVAVNANDITIDSDENANLSQVVVSETATGIQSNVDVTTVTKDEMEEYIKHQHIMVVVSRVDATCTNPGKILYECECGETSEKTIPALGHNYVYSVIKEPTADEKGIGLYRCIRCGEEYTVEIGYSVSVVIDGLNYLTSFIPDGTYTLSVDKQSPILISQEDGATVTAEKIDAIVKVESGKLNGTFSGTVEVDNVTSSETVNFSAVIEENTVFAHYYLKSMRGETAYEYEGTVYTMLSAMVKMGLSQFLPFDLEELSEILPYLGNLGGADGGSEWVLDLLKEAVDGITSTTTANGNTVYTLDIEKIVTSLETLGEKTLDTLIDEILGEGTFTAIAEFATALPDTTVYDVVVTLFDFANEYGISQDAIYSLVQTVIDKVAPGMEISVEELVKGYYDKTVAETVSDIGGITVAQAKEMITNYANQIITTCEAMTVADGVTLLLNLSFGGGTEPPKEDGNYPGDVPTEPSVPSYPDEMLPGDGKDYALLSEGEAEGLTYATLLEMLSYYGNNVTVSVTLNSEHKLVAFEISYIDTESGIQISIIKTAESSIPEIVISLMGIDAGLEETDNGAQITVSVMGVLVTLEAEKTENGATLGFVMGMGDATVADFDLTVDAKKDAQNNVYGADFEVNGVINTEYGAVDVTGKFTAEKNDDTQLDSSVWNSFDGDKSVFNKIDLTFDSNGNPVRLQYVSDESGEYYLLTKTEYYGNLGLVTEAVSTVKILSIDGLPEIMLLFMDDCTDWIGIELEFIALAEVAETQIAGATLKTDVNGLKYVDGGKRGETRSLPARTVNFYGECYYNVKTGECAYQSAHKLTYTAELMTGSKQCYDGILVIETCSECDYTATYERHSHFYTENKINFTTQCGESSYINERECIVCHYKDIESRLSEHNLHYVGDVSFDAETAETLNTEYGFDVTGFYYGSVYIRACAECGLNVYSYTYYTNTVKDGCLRHTAYVVQYNGNVDYEAFEYKNEVSGEGHHGTWSNNNDVTVSEALTEAERIIGDTWPFTPDYVYYSESRCGGCNKLLEKRINLYNEQVGGDVTLYITYGNDGEVSDWSYDGWINNDLELAVREADKYGQSLSGATRSEIHYNVSTTYYNVELRLYDENDSYLYVNVSLYNDYDYYGEMNVTAYYHSQCRAIESYYNFRNGEWILRDTYERERHDINSKYIYSDNCNEDGYLYTYGCVVCGYGSEENRVSYGHNHHAGSYDVDINNWSYRLTDDNLYGLDATLSFDSICYDCNTLIGVTIVLQNNWVLTNDVYIKAEGITLDLNGYSIDLNGYNLAIYSYDGQYLTITDNAFDTSDKEEYTNSITNSKEEGILILFNQSSYGDGYEGTILIGSIAIECDFFGSDTDNRYSIYESLRNDPENGYLDLPMLIAERPVWAF